METSGTYLAHETLLAWLAAIAVDLGNFCQLDTVLADWRSTMDNKVPLVAIRSEDSWLRTFGLEVGGLLRCRQEGREGD